MLYKRKNKAVTPVVEEIKTPVEEVKPEPTPVKETEKKKNKTIIANGRCFGSASLECPLKTVRNYETKILEINKEYNSALIDEGWISLDNVEK